MGNVFCLNVIKLETLNLLFLFAKKRSKRLPWTSYEHEECVPLVVTVDGYGWVGGREERKTPPPPCSPTHPARELARRLGMEVVYIDRCWFTETSPNIVLKKTYLTQQL